MCINLCITIWPVDIIKIFRSPRSFVHMFSEFLYKLSTTYPQKIFIYFKLFSFGFYGVGEISDHVVNTSSFAHHLSNFLSCVHDRSVVPIAE